MSRVVHISPQFLAFERGRKLFETGGACPPKPSDECDGTELSSLLWIGFRVAKGIDWMKRRKVAEMLEMPLPEWSE